ncbi:MAG: uracil-DNA glycosylase [Candidatus Marinimicrobia bacterium]|nr:uracil-DNA glycosylase [Candidatus Neomarinimicrobiota bacterium]MBT3618328.1 uracil-DNA glycosylase [Candidatus Neomarinimicrobiota bacterium]MBT3828273.1 uracil-DNA glycosylase [Candidatus Neomarinimicrobiota bacterium]MBT3997190.1 uracil-DNA glycosylase [Candidatus Neomarinimicrobiota bacterium]MBT4280656.1 uracil-DNA glycosylase [Candidatus Neomarinimicrobiota bacterium]
MAPLYSELIQCAECPRIVDFRTKIAREKRKQFRDWNYWGKPVPGYGDPNGNLLIVGLAPAAHGGNRTARVFTGDKSADFLMKCLHHAGLANQPNSDAVDDGLKLKNTFMTPVLKCVPPGDKPTSEELKNCSGYFQREMELLKPKIILALGKIAFDGCFKYVRKEFDLKVKDYPFGHDKKYEMPNGFLLWGCYHPSPRNVNTGRMTFDMMITLLEKVKKEL